MSNNHKYPHKIKKIQFLESNHWFLANKFTFCYIMWLINFPRFLFMWRCKLKSCLICVINLIKHIYEQQGISFLSLKFLWQMPLPIGNILLIQWIMILINYQLRRYGKMKCSFCSEQLWFRKYCPNCGYYDMIIATTSIVSNWGVRCVQ